MYIDVPARCRSSSAGMVARCEGASGEGKITGLLYSNYDHPPRKSAKLRIHSVAIERRIGGLSDKSDNGLVIGTSGALLRCIAEGCGRRIESVASCCCGGRIVGLIPPAIAVRRLIA